MTVSSQVSFQNYVGSVSLTYAIPFYFIESSQIKVYDITNGVTAKSAFQTGSGVNQFTVVGTDVVFGAGTNLVGKTIQIRRETAKTQPLDYISTGTFPAESHEQGLDRIVMMVQELSDLVFLGDVDLSEYMRRSMIDLGKFDAQGIRVGNAAAAVDGDDFATLDQVISIAAGSQLSLLTFDIAQFFSAPTAGTFTLILESGIAFDINELVVQTTSGTCTAELRIGGVPVNLSGSVTTINASSTKATKTTVDATRRCPVGGRLEIVFSAISSPVNFSISIKCARAIS